MTVKATATMTLALPKAGLAVLGAEEFIGELYLADIGVPAAVYRRLGVEVGPIFLDPIYCDSANFHRRTP